MGKRNHNNKGRIEGGFTPLLRSTMATPAWRQLSHGAVRQYISLKARAPKDRNTAWLSVRNAKQEFKASPRKILEWFAELQHYGFIVPVRPGCLGSDGKGKAPLYRLTELGQTRAASAGGEFEPPTRDFLKWDGTIFKPKRRTNTADGSNRVPGPQKTESRAPRGEHSVHHGGNTPVHHVGNT